MFWCAAEFWQLVDLCHDMKKVESHWVRLSEQSSMIMMRVLQRRNANTLTNANKFLTQLLLDSLCFQGAGTTPHLHMKSLGSHF